MSSYELSASVTDSVMSPHVDGTVKTTSPSTKIPSKRGRDGQKLYLIHKNSPFLWTECSIEELWRRVAGFQETGRPRPVEREGPAVAV